MKIPISTCEICNRNRGHGDHTKCSKQRQAEWIERETAKLLREKELRSKMLWGGR